MLPLIPIAALTAIVGGTGTLMWYLNLSPKEREEADKKANKKANKTKKED